MDVAAWLRELGLERYEQNEIDAEVLPELTEFDLSPLGLPIGPRPKLLKAVTALGCRYSIGNGVTGVYPRSKPADIRDFAVISRASVFPLEGRGGDRPLQRAIVALERAQLGFTKIRCRSS